MNATNDRGHAGEGVGAVGRFQVRRETEDNLGITEVLIKGNIEGKDFVSYNERTLYGLCEDYRTIEVVSNNMLKISKYHRCQKDFEDFEEGLGGDDEDEDYEGLWAYVETEDAGRVINSISSFEDFNKIYASLYECITKNGWGKTVKCDSEKNGATAV